ncbi:MAG: hypothetical protein ABI895_12900 [Deltaproteobacteria bacterium]
MKLHQAVSASLFPLLLTLFSLLCLDARAAAGDVKASQQIDDAVNNHYASADIDVAEKKLLSVIKACTTNCSPSVLARAWMYVGIVRGSGRDDAAGAAEAFKAAKTADPAVKLDDLFATDLVKRVFSQIAAPAGSAGPMPLMEDIKNRAALPEEVTAITCSLQVTEIETQRPIPIACRTAPGSNSVVMSYRHESTTRWRQMPLTKHGKDWVGEIPCTDTAQIGVLQYRLQALDAQGKQVDGLGKEEDPLELSLVETTSAPPPSLPNQPAPATCRPKKKVEPSAPKLGSYGDACSDAAQCQGGLSCISGKCAADVRCESDSECVSGSCIDSQCVSGRDECEGDDCPKQSRAPANWFGLQAGLDFAMMSGDQVCGDGADPSYSCFEGGNPYRGVPNKNFAGNVEGGFRTATARVMLSYERVVSSLFSLEGRFGFAFNGGPESAKSAGGDSSKFVPFHAEGRAKIYFTKVYRDDGRGLKGPSGFVMVGGGLAQVDPHVSVPVAECRQTGLDTAFVPGALNTITEAEQTCSTSANLALRVKEVDVYQRLGRGFVTGGLGFRFGFGKNVAAIASLNTQFLLPSFGFTLSPSLGVAAGF